MEETIKFIEKEIERLNKDIDEYRYFANKHELTVINLKNTLAVLKGIIYVKR